MSPTKLRVISPFHIGSGNELTPVDLYPSDGVVYVLDTKKLTAELLKRGVELEEILQLLKNPPGDAYIWKEYLEEFGLNPGEYSLYTLKVYGETGKTSMQIKEFIKQNGVPYVPGSSVKGAVRTAVLYRVLRNCGDPATPMRLVSKFSRKLAEDIGWSESLVDFYVKYLLGQEKTDPRRADDLLEAIVFGMESDRRSGVRYEPKRDPMRAIIVRDSDPIGKKHLAVYQVNVVPKGIPVWVEGLEPGTLAELEVKFDSTLLQLNGNHFNGLLWECLKDLGNPPEVFEDFVWTAVEEFYRDVRKEELEELNRYPPDLRRTVKGFYTRLEGQNGHVLRLGWGSGWLSMTVGILLRGHRRWKDLREKLGLGKGPSGGALSADFPVTRRLADGTPMGWVVLG